MFTLGRRLLLSRLLLASIIIIIAGSVLRESTSQTPSVTTTTTTTIEWTLLRTFLVTAYNAVEYQTDDTPCISASGMNICETDELICACPREFDFGTEFKINKKVYNCQDRLHIQYNDRIDLLMHTMKEAKEFGIQEMEVFIIK